MLEVSELLKVMDTYKEARGITDSTLSNYIFKSGKTIKGLRQGATLNVNSFNKALIYLQKNWPKHLPLPILLEK